MGLRDMLYRVADRTIDASLFYEAGVVILTWPVNATQPTATVLTSKGAFSALLTDVSEELRGPIGQGLYRARYSGGYVVIWV